MALGASGVHTDGRHMNLTYSPVVQWLGRRADNAKTTVRFRVGLPIFLVIIAQLLDYSTAVFNFIVVKSTAMELNPFIVNIYTSYGWWGFLGIKVILIGLCVLLYQHWGKWVVLTPILFGLVGAWSNVWTTYHYLGL